MNKNSPSTRRRYLFSRRHRKYLKSHSFARLRRNSSLSRILATWTLQPDRPLGSMHVIY